jgi:hypothetical protein
MACKKVIPFNKIKGEIWKDVPGFEGLYSVSNLQRVRSNKRKSSGSYFTVGDKILRPGVHSYGYPKFTLCKDGKLHYLQLHRIMALAFIPNPDNLPCINHIDNDPKNNSIENLEWCTWKHNTRQAYRQERLTKLGERNHMAKLTEEQVLDIFNSTLTTKDAAKKYSVSYQAALDIRSGRRWHQLTGKRHPSVKDRICESEKSQKYLSGQLMTALENTP